MAISSRMNVRRVLAIVVMVACAPGTATVAVAQETTGRIVGTVSMKADQSMLPGVAVEALHVPTGTRYTAVTAANGRYNILNVRVGGPYTVMPRSAASAPRRRRTSTSASARADSWNFGLELESVTESVVVTAESAPLITPDRMGSGTAIAEDKLKTLPTISRQFQDFARTNPYVNTSLGGDEAGSSMSVSGKNNRYNTIQIDGAVNNDLFGLGTYGTPGSQTYTQPISLDAVQELQVVVSPYDIKQSGFTGGAINAITRSGSNTWSASASVARTAGRSSRRRAPAWTLSSWPVGAAADHLEDALDEAAQALIGTATRLSQLYSGPIELGLSGGKDSRLIAAAALAAGLRPKLFTNIDVPEEGETASELVAIVHRTRGIDLNHRLRKVSDPATVLDVGLVERIDRFQRRFDYEYPSSFSVRPPPQLPMEMDVEVGLSGVGGELVSGYWYPKARQTPADTATRQLMRAIPAAALRSDVHAAEDARIRGILAAISEAGLDGEHIIDYLYLVERVRRWYSSAYTFMVVTPFLAPGFVKASFAFDPQHKRERAVHARLLRRLLPEWADIPFVSDTRTSTATRVWQGDGITAIAEMRDTCKGLLPALVEPERGGQGAAPGARGEAGGQPGAAAVRLGGAGVQAARAGDDGGAHGRHTRPDHLAGAACAAAAQAAGGAQASWQVD